MKLSMGHNEMIRWRATSLHLALVALALTAALPACAPPPTAGQSNGAPEVQVSNPVAGQQARTNQSILVTSQSTDPDGIQRVELWADGALVRADINPDVTSPYIVAQAWQSDKAGSHILVVRAYDARRNVGQAQPVAVTLVAADQPTPAAKQPGTAVPTEPPQSLPTATAPAASTRTPMPPTQTPVPPSPTIAPPTVTPAPVCTPPACDTGEVFHCPDRCPGGCGTLCATPTATPTRPTFGPTEFAVHEFFKLIWDKPDVGQQIGYPTNPASDDRQYARQYFERGYMYWWNRPDGPGLIWVVQMTDPGAMTGFGWIGPFEDTWDGADPISCDAALQSAYGPRSGFGRLWCDHPEISQTIGAAREPELGTGQSSDYGVVQLFQGGTMLYSPIDREVWVLVNGGAWQRYYR